MPTGGIKMKGQEAGFTLLEVVIAVVIMGLAFGVLMRGFLGANQLLGSNESHTYVSNWAESKLAEITTGLTYVPQGEISHSNKDYDWSIEERQLDLEAINGGLKKVIIQVEWKEGGRKKSYSLSRLIYDSEGN
jgi:prepilin-type N-terminal cleavage/methylation domain-containing protein